MTHFFAMGGYAMYVWPAYVVFVAILAWDWCAPALRRGRIARELRGRLAREHSRGTRTAGAEASS